jgi:hypothetical protein
MLHRIGWAVQYERYDLLCALVSSGYAAAHWCTLEKRGSRIPLEGTGIVLVKMGVVAARDPAHFRASSLLPWAQGGHSIEARLLCSHR